MRNAVGLVEMTPMTKFEVSGPNAAAWLDRILANRLPAVGKVTLAHHLTAGGGVQAEYMVARLGDDSFYLISTPRAERWNFDDLSRVLPADGSVSLKNVTNDRGCFTVVGPNARDVLQPLTEIDLSNAQFPWFSAKTGSVALASDVRLLRVNYEGELGWELYHPMAYQRQLLDAILKEGERHGMRLVGLHALESLRLEKSYRAMYRDMNPELNALESGLERFIRLDKADFVGRDAVLKYKARNDQRRSVTLKIETDGASTLASEGLYIDGALVGRITSGGYGYTLGHDVALALLPERLSKAGTKLDVTILGEWKVAEVVADSPYDPGNERARM
ncbi:aminomethyltransferase family protein [Mesorhizobium sp. M1B.F.Ca.ET.045.04.1.1]|uniref:aminomethyltransferase family protein n=1 Tax=Mesorhizobium sp. M1B.F.Ca.ET.045.04.1.1 TaxID=2493673 RepID=UPI001FE0C444|nr:aminomethyltransferase family protein [Mesorhizobium sp. M1B.F.Ca.ET.045.04.1.1]